MGSSGINTGAIVTVVKGPDPYSPSSGPSGWNEYFVNPKHQGLRHTGRETHDYPNGAMLTSAGGPRSGPTVFHNLHNQSSLSTLSTQRSRFMLMHQQNLGGVMEAPSKRPFTAEAHLQYLRDMGQELRWQQTELQRQKAERLEYERQLHEHL